MTWSMRRALHIILQGFWFFMLWCPPSAVIFLRCPSWFLLWSSTPSYPSLSLIPWTAANKTMRRMNQLCDMNFKHLYLCIFQTASKWQKTSSKIPTYKRNKCWQAQHTLHKGKWKSYLARINDSSPPRSFSLGRLYEGGNSASQYWFAFTFPIPDTWFGENIQHLEIFP